MILSSEQKINIQLSRALENDLKFPVPEGLAYKPFQRSGIHYATRYLKSRNNVLIADPPGVGKTIQSIGVINYFMDMLKRPVNTLVIVPASILNNWNKELKLWLMDSRGEKISVAYLNTQTMKKGVQADVFIASYGLMSQKNVSEKILNYFDFDICILDEVHFLKNPKSNRTKAVLAKGGLARAATLGTICLTGTPIVNRPIEIFPAVKSLCPVAIGNMTYFEYGLKYCDGRKETKRIWGGKVETVWNFKGFSNMKELGTRLRAHFMIRRKKSDVLPQLPSKTVATTYLSKDSKSNKIIARTSAFDEKAIRSKRTFNNFDFDDEEDSLSTYRRELGIIKAPIAAAYIRTQLESGLNKVVVFAHHTEVMDILGDELRDFGVVEIRGKTSRDQRGRAVDLFQGDKNIRVFLGSLQAAGVGLTLTAASDVRFVEPSWVPGENEQAMDRVHRIGQDNHVLAEYLLFEDDLDDIMIRSQTNKQVGIDKVMS